MKNHNKGLGKAIWRGIRYLQRDNRLYIVESEIKTGKEYWDYWNGCKYKKYSYRWVCEWLNQNPNADVWNDLFQKDSYLKELCKRNKVILYDQLLYYGEEWAQRW